jgi:UV DNA damage endonuclease
MYLHNRLNIPIVFDYLHNAIYNDMSEQEAFIMAYETWKDAKPVFHYSEACEKLRKHADLVVNKINDYDKDVDIMVEAKSKELAVLNWLKINAFNT